MMRSSVLASVLCLVAVAGCSGPPGAGTAGAPSPIPSPLPPLPPVSAAPIGPGASAEELRAEAEAMADRGDYAGAIGALEDALMVDARDREVLRRLVAYLRIQSRAVREGDPAEAYRRIVSGGGYLRTLGDYYPEPTDEERELALDVLYDEAAAHARSLRFEETSGTLRELVAAGFRDFDRVRHDPDFDGMRALPQFQAFFDELAAASEPG